MEHIHLLVSTFDTSNVAVAHNLRSCSRPSSETKTKTSKKWSWSVSRPRPGLETHIPGLSTMQNLFVVPRSLLCARMYRFQTLGTLWSRPLGRGRGWPPGNALLPYMLSYQISSLYVKPSAWMNRLLMTIVMLNCGLQSINQSIYISVSQSAPSTHRLDSISYTMHAGDKQQKWGVSDSVSKNVDNLPCAL